MPLWDLACDSEDPDVKGLRLEFQRLSRCSHSSFRDCFKLLSGKEFASDATAYIKWFCSRNDSGSVVLASQFCDEMKFVTSPKGAAKPCVFELIVPPDNVTFIQYELTPKIQPLMQQVMKVARHNFY